MKGVVHSTIASFLIIVFAFVSVFSVPLSTFAQESEPVPTTEATEDTTGGITTDDMLGPLPEETISPEPTPVDETPIEATPTPETEGIESEAITADAVAAEDYTPLQPQPIDPLENIADLTGKHTVNEFSGTFEYDYPIPLPAGRNGLTPQLSLHYNNSDRNIYSPVGYGWSLDIPKIERFSRTGIEDLYTKHNFTSPFAGGAGELAPNGANPYGEYVPKVVAGAVKHEFKSDNTWEVTDANGTVYVFGETSDDRIEITSPARTHTWYLSSVTDTNGNTIDYGYQKRAGHLYPKNITWGDSDDPFEVRFYPYYSGEYSIVLPDWLPSFSRGFAYIEKMDLLELITVHAPGTEDIIKYELTYHARSGKYKYDTIDYLAQIKRIGVKGGVQYPDNPTVFDYTAYDGSRSFPLQNPRLIIGESMTRESPPSNGAQEWTIGDKNSDGWEDLIKDIYFTNGYEQEVWLNQGNGTWIHQVETPDDYYWFSYINDCAACTGEMSPMFLDLNGDGVTSFCRKDLQNTYWSNVGNVVCSPHEGVSNIGGRAQDVQFLDFNGDALLDIFTVNTDSSSAWISKNPGSGQFMPPSGSWAFAPDNANRFMRYGTSLTDINNDGLDDFVHRYQQKMDGNITLDSQKILLSSAAGWQNIGDTIALMQPLTTQRCYDGSCRKWPLRDVQRLYDVNRDGLPDLVESGGNSTTPVYLNTGKGWSATATTTQISGWIYYGNTYQDGSLYDMNKDGILEAIKNYGQHIATLPEPPILTSITTGFGGKLDVEYTPASSYQYDNGDPANFELPIPRLTPSKFTVSGANIPTGVTEYHYAGGKLFIPNVVKGVQEQEMVGFATVTKTLPDGSTIITEYNQGDAATEFANKGNPKKQRIYKADDTLLFETRNKYQVYERVLNKSYQALPIVSLELTYSPSNPSQYKTRGMGYAYDDYGNQVYVADYGEVLPAGTEGDFSDLNSDSVATTIEYAYNTTANIVSLPKRSITQDYNLSSIGEQRLHYDNQPYGSAPIKGNLTKVSNLLKTGPNVWQDTNITYNSFGLPTSITNARNFTTSYTYDSHNLFPASVTNAKNHTASYSYNYLFGTPTEITDPNSNKQFFSYDGLGRLTETQVTDPESPPAPVTIATVSYDLTSTPVKVTQTALTGENDTQGAPIAITSISYFDGLGRPLQTRTETEGVSTFIVTQTAYDERGQVSKEFLPQEKTGSAYSALSASEAGTSYSYDALGRILTATTPVGTTTTAYDRWTQTVTDPNGEVKDFASDARGNLTSVTEHLDGQTYTTSYAYDPNQNLTQITDAKGNKKNFSYDLLGRLLSETDLHLPTDSTFGTWSHSYDLNGNLTTTTDPKGQVTSFAYDELDRLLTEDSDQQTGIEVTYSYDSAPNGKGLPATITSSAITKAFAYDTLGRVTAETRTISGTPYVTETAYDLVGNPLTISYPDTDNTEITYAYNNAGQLETVRQTAGAAIRDIVTNINYAPHGAPKFIAYGNGVETTQTYAIAQLYRMTGKLTEKDTTKLQDLSYSFDPVGNITEIIDASDTDTAKTSTFTYDDLHRLKTATITNAANGDNYTRSYSYDILGNITNKSDVGAYSYAGGVSATAQGVTSNPHAVTQAGGQSFTYDNNGNLATDGTWTHTWDYKDRLKTSGTTATFVEYAYDEGVTRVTKLSDTTGKLTTYVSDLLDIEDGEEKLAVFANGDLKLATITSGTGGASSTTCNIPPSGDWTVTADCTIADFQTAPGNVTVNAGVVLKIATSGILEVDFANHSLTVTDSGGVLVKQGGSLAQTGRLSPPQSGGSSENLLVFHHSDHLTGASVDTDATGTLLQLTDYYPFGDSRIEDTTTAFHNDYTYTGKERDEDTELLYYEARYYDSTLGRFLSLDPWKGDITDPQSLNKYAYAFNNPLKYIDPEGKSACLVGVCPDDFIGALVGLGDEAKAALRFGGSFALKATGIVGAFLTNVPSAGEGEYVQPLGVVSTQASSVVQVPPLSLDVSPPQKNTIVSDDAINNIIGGSSPGDDDPQDPISKMIRNAKRGVKSLVNRIKDHKGYIRDPKSKVEGWDKLSQKAKEGLIKHWRKEIKTFRDNIKKEAKKIEKLRKKRGNGSTGRKGNGG